MATEADRGAVILVYYKFQYQFFGDGVILSSWLKLDIVRKAIMRVELAG